jgi:hypothetical protein
METTDILFLVAAILAAVEALRGWPSFNFGWAAVAVIALAFLIR